ncbi:MAG: ADP-ribosylglycohydrolase family protein [Desulfovermiculus sp.]|nr:ADP-ribosylglycohydrolase family protein [Desulfovermiculus sp.]
MSTSTRRATVWGSFLGDSLALGAHWIYDQEKIVRSFGRVENLVEPLSGSQHAGKQAGQFTHYADQTLILLRSLAATGKFDRRHFADLWRDFWTTSSSYVDQATRGTLANMDQGKDLDQMGSGSNDLAGAARIAPLIYLLQADVQALVQACREQTQITHRDGVVVDSAEFFARVAVGVLSGKKPVQALQDTAGEGFTALPAKKWVQTGLDAADRDSVEAIRELGKTCHAPHAFPGTIQLIARHEEDLPEALIQCVMAGGDSAARGMLVGMILGAYHGMDALPEPWMQDLQVRQEIERLLGELDIDQTGGFLRITNNE